MSLLDVKSPAPRDYYLALTAMAIPWPVILSAVELLTTSVRTCTSSEGQNLPPGPKGAVESDFFVVVATRSQPDTDPAYH